jgi:hypothetical protein
MLFGNSHGVRCNASDGVGDRLSDRHSVEVGHGLDIVHGLEIRHSHSVSDCVLVVVVIVVAVRLIVVVRCMTIVVRCMTIVVGDMSVVTTFLRREMCQYKDTILVISTYLDSRSSDDRSSKECESKNVGEHVD